MKIHISSGNSKIGSIPNSSTLPGSRGSCGRDCEGCYAKKALCYPSVRTAWGENTDILKRDLGDFIAQHDEWLAEKRPPCFRFDVGGDFYTREHIESTVELCAKHSNTAFLAFSKRLEWFPHLNDIPKNFSLIASQWPGVEPRPGHWELYPHAWLAEDIRLEWLERSKKTFKCYGTCDQCGACFSIRDIGKDVVFDRH